MDNMFKRFCGMLFDPIGSKFRAGIQNGIERMLSSMGILMPLVSVMRDFKTAWQKAETPGEKIKLLVMKFLASIIKAFVKAIKWLFTVLGFPTGFFVLLILIVVLFIGSLWGALTGSFHGSVIFNMDYMQRANQDIYAVSDTLNQSAIREAFYQQVSDTSIYQAFSSSISSTEKADAFTQLMSDVFFGGDVNEYRSTKKYVSEDLDGESFLTFWGNGTTLTNDTRYLITDANRNPVYYLKQAQVVGSNYDNSINDYFRDYWNREDNFKISNNLLFELNRWLFSGSKTEIVYPEAVTKPIQFVTDFYRIQNDVSATDFGKPYTYISQRVTLDDIRNAASPFFKMQELEGIIYSTPSDIIYDYMVDDVNTNGATTTTAASYELDRQTIDYGDGSTDYSTVAKKIYWRIKADKMDVIANVTITAENYAEYLDGPYSTLTIAGGRVELSDKFTSEFDYNLYPKKHIQSASLTDADGLLRTSSSVLFNKIYIQRKAVESTFRNSDAYWTKFASFIERDLNKNNWDNGKCSVNGISYDEEILKPWDERECSTIRQSVCQSFLGRLECSAKNVLELITNTSMNIPDQTVYQMLTDYEDYLIKNGTIGNELEYRYFTSTGFEAKEIVDDLNSFGNIGDMFNNDEQVYKNTYDSAVELSDGTRSVSTEYVPVAIVSGGTNNLNADNDYVGDTPFGWGWKIVTDSNGNPVKDSNGNYKIKQVYGESSLQFPEYFNDFSSDASAVFDEDNVTEEDAITYLRSFSDFLFGTTYGEVTYCGMNFKYFWNDSGSLVNSGSLWDITKNAQTAFDKVASNGKTEYKILTDIDPYSDIRNTEYVWNPTVQIWRPEQSTSTLISVDETHANEIQFYGTMQSCNDSKGQCGRATYMTESTDYLPMELKSVKSYGLASVLSYAESQIVVFKSGVVADQEYDTKAIVSVLLKLAETYPLSILNTLTGNDADLTDISTLLQYIPDELMTEKVEITIDGEKQYKSLADIYATTILPRDELTAIAKAFTEAQVDGKLAVGSSNVTVNETTYCILNDDLAVGVAEGSVCVDKFEQKLKLYMPILNNLTNSIAQYSDPMSYYSYWLTGELAEANNNLFSKRLGFVSENFNTVVDTALANTLRNVTYKNNSETQNDRTYIKVNINGKTIRFTENEWTDFTSAVSSTFNSVELIDRVRSQRIFIIQEAATFLGDFLYSYKDKLDFAQTVGNNAQSTSTIISDLLFVNKYSYLSNYQFSLPLVKEDISYDSGNSESDPCSFSENNGENKYCYSKEAIGLYAVGYTCDIVTGDNGKKTQTNCHQSSKTKIDSVEDMQNYHSIIGTGSQGVYQHVFYLPEESKSYDYTIAEKIIDDNDRVYFNSLPELLKIYNWLVANGKSSVAQKIFINLKYYADLSELFKATDGNILLNYNSLNNGQHLSLEDNYTQQGTNETNSGVINAEYGSNIDSYGSYDDYKNFIGAFESLNLRAFRTDILGENGKDMSKITATANEIEKLVNSGKTINYNSISDTALKSQWCVDDLGWINDKDQTTILKSEDGTVQYTNLKGEGNNGMNYILTEKDLDALNSAMNALYGKAYNTVRTADVELNGEVVATLNLKQILDDNSDNMGISIAAVDRSLGTAYPIYKYLIGATEEIAPIQQQELFNGELLSSWSLRIAMKDSDTLFKQKYISKQREETQSYLYTYFTHFETYIPLDVKEDDDLIERGVDSFLSLNINTNSHTVITSSYTAKIFDLVNGDAEWTSLISEMSNEDITPTVISQVLAGLIETNFKHAAYTTIAELNNQLRENGAKKDMLICVEGYDGQRNTEIIEQALQNSAYSTATETSTDYINIELTLENGTVKSFHALYLGPGCIKATIQSSISQITTKDTAVGISESTTDQDLIIAKSGTFSDDRLNLDKSLRFVSIKFRKLLEKYGCISWAIMAYCYGENYWDNMLDVATSDAAKSTGPEWYTDDAELIQKALGITLTSDVDTKLYTKDVVDETLAFVSGSNARVALIQSYVLNGMASYMSDYAKEASSGNRTYEKFKAAIDSAATEFNVDAALIAAVWTAESGGNSLINFCSSDNVVTDSTKAKENETTSVNEYSIQNTTCRRNDATGENEKYELSSTLETNIVGIGSIHAVCSTESENFSYTDKWGISWCTINKQAKTSVTGKDHYEFIYGDAAAFYQKYNAEKDANRKFEMLEHFKNTDARLNPFSAAEWTALLLGNSTYLLAEGNKTDAKQILVVYNAGVGPTVDTNLTGGTSSGVAYSSLNDYIKATFNFVADKDGHTMVYYESIADEKQRHEAMRAYLTSLGLPYSSGEVNNTNDDGLWFYGGLSDDEAVQWIVEHVPGLQAWKTIAKCLPEFGYNENGWYEAYSKYNVLRNTNNEMVQVLNGVWTPTTDITRATKYNYVNDVLKFYSEDNATINLEINAERGTSAAAYLKHTAALNTFESDLMATQNSGIMSWPSVPKTYLKKDAESIFLGAMSDGDNVITDIDGYDLMNMFAGRAKARTASAKSTWFVNGNIIDYAYSSNELMDNAIVLAKMPPLFPLSNVVQVENPLITSQFGKRNYTQNPNHTGIDLAVASVPVYAAADGMIIADATSEDCGHYIRLQVDMNQLSDDQRIIETESGSRYSIVNVIFRYLHLTANSSTSYVGANVVGGEQLAISGNTGMGHSYHLHFDVYITAIQIDNDGNPIGETINGYVDPLPWLSGIWENDDGERVGGLWNLDTSGSLAVNGNVQGE